MATAVVIMAGGLAVVATPSALAAGETISLGSISTNPVAGTASTKTIAVTTTNVSGGTPLSFAWVADASGSACSPSCTPTGLSTTMAVVSGNVATITLTVANSAVAGSYYLKVTPSGATASAVATITVDSAQQQNNNSSSSSSSDAAAIAAAAAQRAAAVVAAKSTIVDTLKAGKPVTAADLSAADIAIASAKAADRVNAKILALPAEKRADLATLQTLVRTENFVDKVSTAATQIRVTSRDLVIEQLIPADYKHKASVIRAILAQNAASLDSIEKVEAVVKAAVSAIQARKDRIAAIIAKINGTK